MQFNNGKLNANVHMGRVIKTPETSNPSAFLSAKLQPEHRQKPDNDLQATQLPTHLLSPQTCYHSLSLSLSLSMSQTEFNCLQISPSPAAKHSYQI